MERLAGHDVRFTAGRRAVFRLLSRADGPLSAGEIHRQLKTLPLSSIYRTLTVLEESEILSLHHTRGVTRYELADWIAGHHHHVVCAECGSVADVMLSPSLEDALERVVASASQGVGFSHDGHSLEIEGRCSSCR